MSSFDSVCINKLTTNGILGHRPLWQKLFRNSLLATLQTRLGHNDNNVCKYYMGSISAVNVTKPQPAEIKGVWVCMSILLPMFSSLILS